MVITQERIWGMLHLPPLPGSPRNTLSIKEIYAFIRHDTETLIHGGIKNVVLENFGDTPFFKDISMPQTVALMVSIAQKLIIEFPTINLGINVLRNDAISALAIAKALEPNSKFIRVNILTGAYITDQGIIEGKAAELLRYRREISGEKIEIWADIHVKHASSLDPRPIETLAIEALERNGASKIIISGEMTGKPTDLVVLQKLEKTIPREKIVVGSGITPENFRQYQNLAGYFIVGSCLKKDNKIENPILLEKVEKLMENL
ncbi:MAG: BtpA/SgcQ family protein [Candidatus Thorarchaeota archaeon]